MKLSISKIIEVEDVFTTKNWEIIKDEDKHASIFNRFCSRLAIFDTEKQDLILELTADFLNIALSELAPYFLNSIKKIEGLEKYKTIIISPLKMIAETKTKSSDHLWYHLSSFCDFSYEVFEKKLKFISEWSRIEKTIKKEDSLLVLIDDYIGSGQTVNDVIGTLIESNYLKCGVNYKVLSLIATEKGIRNINDKYGDIVVCDKIVHRGLSDKYKDQELVKNKILMLEMENTLKVSPAFSFGFAQSESLVAIQNKSPNNTFPIFWLQKKDNLAPFKNK